jgi:hypothetical protein
MDGEELAVPSVFVIGRDRHIHWRRIGVALMDRPSTADILAAVDEAASAKR